MDAAADETATVNLPCNVIVLDEDKNHSLTVVSILNEHPTLYQAVECFTPRNAIHTLRNGTYHIIFMGYPLGNDDARQLLLTANSLRIPVIVFIANYTHPHCLEWIKEGAHLCLEKPLEHRGLIIHSWQHCVPRVDQVVPRVDQVVVAVGNPGVQGGRRASPFNWTGPLEAAFNAAITSLEAEQDKPTPTKILHYMNAYGVVSPKLSIIKNHLRRYRLQEAERNQQQQAQRERERQLLERGEGERLLLERGEGERQLLERGEGERLLLERGEGERQLLERGEEERQLP